jgi:hypothetical protein
MRRHRSGGRQTPPAHRDHFRGQEPHLRPVRRPGQPLRALGHGAGDQKGGHGRPFHDKPHGISRGMVWPVEGRGSVGPDQQQPGRLPPQSQPENLGRRPSDRGWGDGAGLRGGARSHRAQDDRMGRRRLGGGGGPRPRPGAEGRLLATASQRRTLRFTSTPQAPLACPKRRR